MKILLVGGSGVLGRSFCRQAKQRKDLRITALVRSRDKGGEALEHYGVSLIEGSILDLESIRKAVPGHEVVLNFASALPRKLKPSPRDWEMNDVIRTRGAANVMESLKDRDCFYCQAGIVFLYGDHGGKWISEESPINPSRHTQSSKVMENLFLQSPNPGLRGVSMRFSLFYHQDAWHTQAMIRELRKRRFPIVGDGEYFWNLIHVDDAAMAVHQILEKRDEIQGREIMIVSDDEPVTCKDFLQYLCRLMGVPEPTRIPQFVAKMALSHDIVETLTASFRCKTDKIKQLGWKPVFRSFREGFPTVLQFI